MWTVVYLKQAAKDSKKIELPNLKSTVKHLIEIIKNNPFENPPPYEKLVGDSCGGFHTPALCAVIKGMKADCNHLIRTTYPDVLRRGIVDLAGKYSRRINIRHRLIYEVFEKEHIVRILRM